MLCVHFDEVRHATTDTSKLRVKVNIGAYTVRKYPRWRGEVLRRGNVGRLSVSLWLRKVVFVCTAVVDWRVRADGRRVGSRNLRRRGRRLGRGLRRLRIGGLLCHFRALRHHLARCKHLSERTARDSRRSGWHGGSRLRSIRFGSGGLQFRLSALLHGRCLCSGGILGRREKGEDTASGRSLGAALEEAIILILVLQTTLRRRSSLFLKAGDEKTYLLCSWHRYWQREADFLLTIVRSRCSRRGPEAVSNPTRTSERGALLRVLLIRVGGVGTEEVHGRKLGRAPACGRLCQRPGAERGAPSP